ncbi:response regulator transcription factor [Treponema primitia]|uniref:response regulator transcription factor n=1 Tax=Treponema primitia TaxID=88058 RepID=UPI0002554E91|nr:response regulator transcription factor [Treponema primitia]
MIRILIVEDMTMLREALTTILSGEKDMEVVGALEHAGDALEFCRQNRPDLILMDVLTDDNLVNGGSHRGLAQEESSHTQINGISATQEILAEFPDTKIIIITAFPEITFIEAARKAGAHSFVYKNVKNDLLLQIIRGTMAGYGTFPTHVPTLAALSPKFTDREMRILRLLAQARDRSFIEQELNISEGTLKAVITGILNKTGYDSIMQYVVYAVANGLISPHG